MDKYQVRSCFEVTFPIGYDNTIGNPKGRFFIDTTGASANQVLTYISGTTVAWAAGGGGGATWGGITGTLSAQTDLQNALDLKQNESIVINSNTTAVLDGVYTVVASATFTDPTPAEGKGFTVFVRNGTATVGGIAYATAGTIINRIYHSGAWANYTSSTALTINTTPIGSGTVGRVLFQGTGDVLQQSANLFWNNTDGRLNIGGVGTASGRLTILSPATTGLALHIRNSADTTNQLEFNGDARMSIFNAANSNGLYFVNGGSAGSGYLIGSSAVASGTNKFIVISPGSLQFFDTASGARTVFAFNNSPTGNLTLDNNADRFRVTHSTWSSFAIESANGCLALQDSNARRPTSGARCVLMVTNGTKSTDTADTFQLIAKDIVAGNAAPHFYTELGHEIKLYQTNTGNAYNITNVTTDRSYDANATTLDEVADVLGTLIADLKLTGIII
jgi:hypothetical protein